jgi:hypothetical protein
MSRRVSRVKTRDYVLEDPIRYTPVDEERNRIYRRWARWALMITVGAAALGLRSSRRAAVR